MPILWIDLREVALDLVGIGLGIRLCFELARRRACQRFVERQSGQFPFVWE